MNKEPIKFKAKCPNCGTEFKATKDDVAFDLDFCTHKLIALFWCARIVVIQFMMPKLTKSNTKMNTK